MQLSDGINTGHSFEQKQREGFFKGLRALLGNIPCHVSLWARPDPSWLRLNEQFNIITASLISEIQKALAKIPTESDESVKVRVDGLVFSVRHNETFDLGFDMSEPEYFGDFPEQLFAQAVSAAIRNKLERKKPEIQPCVLVVYPNTGLVGIHYDKVILLIRATISCEKMGTHFNEVYISSDHNCIRICPE